MNRQSFEKLDAFTRQHLIAWLENQWQSEHETLLDEIDRALTEEPDLIERCLSWPEIAQRGRQ